MKKIPFHFIFGLGFLVLVGSANAFPAVGNLPDKKKDTLAPGVESRGFKDLFSANGYNSNGSYAAQINPQVMPFVQGYLVRHQKHLMHMKGWAMPYFNMIDGVLMGYGLPRELKYLAVIESDMKPFAVSWAGAVGPWQFMPETGRRMGLRIGGYVDERTDYLKSTHAAARYLKELYGQLGDWLLVIAAYNGGPGRVQSAIRRSGSKSFWRLQNYLPEESKNHVKKFISTHYIMEGTGGQTTSTAEEWKNHQSQYAKVLDDQRNALPQEMLDNTDTTQVQGRYNSVVVASHLTMDILTFNKLNPNFDQRVFMDEGYNLRLPKEKMELFKANRFNILYQSIIATVQQANQPKR